MRLRSALFFMAVALLALDVDAGCRDLELTHSVDHQRLWLDISQLASADMEGRETGQVGAKRAADYIQQQFRQMQLQAFDSDASYLAPFRFRHSFTDKAGVNVMGWVRGQQAPDTFIVVTAHYDHIGKQGRKIFYGADDNASGVAALLALARHTVKHGSRNSIIFLATDAEEKGLFGAKAFVADPPVSLASIRFNLNLDMLAQGSSRKRLYISAKRGVGALNKVVDAVISEAGLCLIKNHRRSEPMRTSSRRTNWTRASDHGAFAAVDIPYLYIGVGEHRDYHKPTDTVERIPRDFFYAAVETSLKALLRLDRLQENEAEIMETD